MINEGVCIKYKIYTIYEFQAIFLLNKHNGFVIIGNISKINSQNWE